MFDISELFIECNKDSCCEHITVYVNIYLYRCFSLPASDCSVCLCVFMHVSLCVRDIKSEYEQKTTLCGRPQ